MFEVLGKSLAYIDIYFFYLQSVNTRSKIINEVIVHVAAVTGVAFSTVSLRTSLNVMLHILSDSHAGKSDVVVDAGASVGNFDDAACLDGVGC